MKITLLPILFALIYPQLSSANCRISLSTSRVLRTKASVKSSAIQTAQPGENVTVIGYKNNHWVKVRRPNGTVGYIATLKGQSWRKYRGCKDSGNPSISTASAKPTEALFNPSSDTVLPTSAVYRPGELHEPGLFNAHFKSASPKGPYNNRYALPMSGEDSTEGPCGEKHIRGHRTRPYMNPTTACLFSAVNQAWQQTFCQGNQPHCRVMFGDAGYGRSKPGEWPHKTHKDGTCIDIWPMRQPEKGLVETTIHQKSIYSRDLTSKYMKLLVSWGIENRQNPEGNSPSKHQALFNDPELLKDSSLGFRRVANHDDHLHVCFRDSAKNRKLCNQFKRDPAICHLGRKTQTAPATRTYNEPVEL